MRYQACYDWGLKMLEEAGIGEADLDARLMLEWVCGTKRHDLLVHGDREVELSCEERYKEMISLRSGRMPYQYIIGQQEFMGLPFAVNEAVLIPRQDTETLVEKALFFMTEGMHILDMCTGSGCILISLLYYGKGSTGVGVDISAPALTVASENAVTLLGGENIRFVESNLFENQEIRENREETLFDMIVSNPPYIRSHDIEELMPEVKEHEPRTALDGTGDGLYFYREISRKSRMFLKPGGRLLFEIGADQAADVREILKGEGFTDIEIVKDLAGLDRVAAGRFPEGRLM